MPWRNKETTSTRSSRMNISVIWSSESQIGRLEKEYILKSKTGYLTLLIFLLIVVVIVILGIILLLIPVTFSVYNNLVFVKPIPNVMDIPFIT